MDGFCVFFAVLLYSLLLLIVYTTFSFFPLSQSRNTFQLSWGGGLCMRWMDEDGLWNGRRGCLLLGLGGGAVDFLPGQFSDGTEFRGKGISTFGGSTNPSVN
jgi:hypothetical protein